MNKLINYKNEIYLKNVMYLWKQKGESSYKQG